MQQALMVNSSLSLHLCTDSIDLTVESVQSQEQKPMMGTISGRGWVP